MSNLSASTRISRISELISASLDGEILLMDIDHGIYVGLTGTGRHIWDLIEPSCEFGDLCDRLQEHYRSPPGKIASDLTLFINKLADQKLITLS